LISKCLFPAAGYGTRFLPATKAIPKEMLPILTKPLLQYGVEEALSAGIDYIAIVTGRGKRAIEDHFDDSFELEYQLNGTPKEKYLTDIKNIINRATFTYVRQQKMLGLGDAILTGEPLIGDEPFAVILADDLCHTENLGVTAQMIEVYNKFKCSIVAIEEVPNDQISQYGVISGEQIDDLGQIFQVSKMIEKPEPNDAPSNMAIIGRYILTPDIFNIIRKIKANSKGEIEITNALNIQAQKGKVLAIKFKGDRFDCGTIKGFIKATNFYANYLQV
jgi:UTP--glucose-1-phosphate uridylyltransferase